MAKDPLVPCPRGCGTWVKESKAGDPHTYFDRAGSNKTIVCKD